MATTTVAAREKKDTSMAVRSGKSTAAPSPVLPMAMATPTGARMSPMTMMTGPVTMVGRSLVRNAGPRRWMTSATAA
ncbi:hypothetical protein DSECCO2_601430 [anaerobic digester metagenome]